MDSENKVMEKMASKFKLETDYSFEDIGSTTMNYSSINTMIKVEDTGMTETEPTQTTWNSNLNGLGMNNSATHEIGHFQDDSKFTCSENVSIVVRSEPTDLESQSDMVVEDECSEFTPTFTDDVVLEKNATEEATLPVNQPGTKRKKQVFPCSLCNQTFSTVAKLYKHKASHKISCDVCDKTFKQQYLLDGHMREHAGEHMPYWCDLCEKRFSLSTKLMTHRYVHNRTIKMKCQKKESEKNSTENRTKQVFSCSFCSETFPTNNKLCTHMASHKLTCVVCDKAFMHQYLHAGHMREHAGEEMPYWCDLCEKRFSSFAKLMKHKYQHKRVEKEKCDEREWKCTFCGFCFSRKDNLRVHMKVHTDPDRYKCQVCGKHYSSAGSLKQHSVIHQDDKPFKCEMCDKRFNYKSNLLSHMPMHTPEKQLQSFKCDICEISFQSKTTYGNHMNIHRGAKPFACDVCGKTFTQLSFKLEHEMTHVSPSSSQSLTESESYDCDHCVLSFTKLKYLDEHLKTHKLAKGNVSPSSNRDVFTCIVCEISCGNKRDLHSHILDSHCHKEDDLNGKSDDPSRTETSKTPDITDYKCNYCTKYVDTKRIQFHMRIHGPKQFVCRVCRMRFHQASHAHRHMRQHTGDTPFECKVCEKRFIAKERLKNHMVEHGGRKVNEKKFKCEKCGKRFLDNSALSKHIDTHVDKYKCSVCKQTFWKLEMFEKHRLIH